MHAADKNFLTLLLPLAIATFFSAPLAVLHSFDLVDPFVHRLHRAGSALVTPVVQTEVFPQEIPILYQLEPYPASGNKAIVLKDLRFWNMTHAINGTLMTNCTRVFLGYVPTTEALTPSKEGKLPKGELLEVLQAFIEQPSSNNTYRHQMHLQTRRVRQFQLQKVRMDEVNGVLYGRVELVAA